MTRQNFVGKVMSLLFNMLSRAFLVAQMVKHLPAMQESWVQSKDWEDTLEKEMATHSGTLAWRIPWTEDPGRLQSTGLQRSGTTEHFHFHFHFHFLSKSLQMVTAVMKLKDSCSLGEKL